MNSNKNFRLLLSGFILLLILNLALINYIIRPVNSNEIKSLNKINRRLDSITLRITLSHQRIDTVLGNINRSLELSRQLDEQVIDLSSAYEKDRVSARKKLEVLKEQMRKENEKLESLRNELKQL